MAKDRELAQIQQQLRQQVILNLMLSDVCSDWRLS